MSKHTPPLYALVSITETEGLEDGKYWVKFPAVPELALKPFENGKWNANYIYIADSYLRPLPEGTVAVSERELSRLLGRVWEASQQRHAEEEADYYGKKEEKYKVKRKPDYIASVLSEFITTKLAQMGE